MNDCPNRKSMDTQDSNYRLGSGDEEALRDALFHLTSPRCTLTHQAAAALTCFQFWSMLSFFGPLLGPHPTRDPLPLLFLSQMNSVLLVQLRICVSVLTMLPSSLYPGNNVHLCCMHLLLSKAGGFVFCFCSVFVYWNSSLLRACLQFLPTAWLTESSVWLRLAGREKAASLFTEVCSVLNSLVLTFETLSFKDASRVALPHSQCN